MHKLYEGFSQRLNNFLDEYDFAEGRKRSSAMEEFIGVSRYTAQQMVKHDKPPKDTTLCKMIEKINSELDVREVTAHLLYGVGPEKFLAEKRDISLVAHIFMAIETRAEALEIDVSSIPTSGLERICSTVYQNATNNHGKIDQKLIISELIDYLPE